MNPPKLEAPGAGLPWFERNWLKYYYVGYRFPRYPWEMGEAFFDRETQIIRKCVEPLSMEQLQTPQLIPRIRAMEDSSRFWSVAMTLEHLMIVGTGMSQIILKLSEDQPFSREIDIAKVKPLGQMLAGMDSKKAGLTFKNSMHEIQTLLKTGIKNKKSKRKHPHPWFGPMTAHQWLWIMAGHQSTHRKQIQSIITLGT